MPRVARLAVLSLAALALAGAPLAVSPPTADAIAPVRPAASAARTAAPTLAALPATSAYGRTLTLRGTAAKGVTVVVQRAYAGGSFAKVATVHATRKGTWTARVPLVSGGTTRFRAVSGSKSSAVRALKVYRWLDLGSQPQLLLTESGFLQTNVPVTITGKTSPRAYLGGGEIQVLYDTGQQCTQAEALSGFSDDDSAGDDTQHMQAGDASAQTASVDHQTPGGQRFHVTFSLTGVETFAFVVGVEDGGDGQPSDALTVLAAPRAYCNADALPAPSTMAARSATTSHGWVP